MPMYEYECGQCGAVFELIQKFADDPLTLHPGECGGAVRRLISAPAFQFKGTGWYVTDYAKSGSKKDPSTGKDRKSDSGDSKSDSSSNKDSSGSKDSSSKDSSGSKDSSKDSSSSGSSSKDSSSSSSSSTPASAPSTSSSSSPSKKD